LCDRVYLVPFAFPRESVEDSSDRTKVPDSTSRFLNAAKIETMQTLLVTMTRITQLEDRGAAVAWSPIGSHSDFIALGAKVGFYG